MPTNKLWLEHTERAAWDTVRALRDKLAVAEERLQRLAPAGENWQAIVEALERARRDCAIVEERYADVANTLVDELLSTRSKRDELHRALEEKSMAAAPIVAPSERHSQSLDRFEEIWEDGDPDLARVLRELVARYERQPAPARPSRSELRQAAEALERRLEELEEVSSGELAEEALVIATLALRVSVLARRGKTDRRAEWDESDE